MTSATDLAAVALAALGALFFGLASVRQHGAVHASAVPGGSGLQARVVAGLRLVRQPAWLLGAGQAGLGGGLHVAALALAPITLVQPIGVLAVPVSVLAAAAARRRRPSHLATAGTLLSVVGVAALSVVLLLPQAGLAALPAWTALAGAVGAVLVAATAVVLLLGRAGVPPLVRCAGRAVVAAVLFGLVSVLVRTLGQVVRAPAGVDPALVVTAGLGIGLALPLGVWAMQSAYLFGAPQVVVCCLTLVDPLTAVVAGRTLLHDGAALTGATLLLAVACALTVAVGVVLLARDHPTEAGTDGSGRSQQPEAVLPAELVGAAKASATVRT